MNKFQEWRSAANTQRIKRRWLARLWFALALAGVVHAVWHIGLPIEKSIPVLFFVSLYANYATEKSTEQGLAVEMKQEAAIEGEAHS